MIYTSYKTYFKNQKGFTLVELILYISLITLFLTAAILFSWDVIYGREKSARAQTVQSVARLAISRMGYEVERANSIVSITSSKLVLAQGAATTAIELVGDRVQLSRGLDSFYITSNQVKVTNLAFTDASTPDSNSKNIKIDLTIAQANPPGKGELTADTTVSDSFELKGQFNSARALLVGTSLTSLVSGISVGGITIQNVGSSDLTIDKMRFSWTPSSGQNITQVQIGAGSVEWSGSSPNGSTVDLADFIVTSGAPVVNVDSLTFSGSMLGTTLSFEFILSDGSNAWAKVNLTPSTPTPTPTPIPTPPGSSCTSVCQAGGYLIGNCRKNAATCTSNGEIYVSGGDQYCTGGPNADTCCCLP